MKGHMESMYEDQPYRKPHNPITEEPGYDHAFDTVMATEINWDALDEVINEVIEESTEDTKVEGLPFNADKAYDQIWDEIDSTVNTLKDLENYDIEIWERYLDRVE
jgi:predicted GTPase